MPPLELDADAPIGLNMSVPMGAPVFSAPLSPPPPPSGGQFIDDNGVMIFVDDNGVILFVDDNGVTLG